MMMNTNTGTWYYRRSLFNLFQSHASCLRRNGEVLEYSRVKDGCITWHIHQSHISSCSKGKSQLRHQKMDVDFINVSKFIQNLNIFLHNADVYMFIGKTSL